MKKYFFPHILITLLILFCVFLGVGFFYFRYPNHSQMVESLSLKKGHVMGAIVPHHAPLTGLIDETLKQVSAERNSKTIVLIGPNHADAGIGPALSRLTSWDLPTGRVDMDTEVISHLVQQGLVAIDEKTLIPEHSMYTVLPVIQKYFPQAQVVPIILSSTHDKNRSQRLGERIGELLQNPDVLLIASIDFSHYLSSDIAPLKDSETLDLIEKRDYDLIERMPTAYFDSGPSLMTFLRAVDFNGRSHGHLIFHTNSGLFAGEPIQSSTSYMTFIFRALEY